MASTNFANVKFYCEDFTPMQLNCYIVIMLHVVNVKATVIKISRKFFYVLHNTHL